MYFYNILYIPCFVNFKELGKSYKTPARLDERNIGTPSKEIIYCINLHKLASSYFNCSYISKVCFMVNVKAGMLLKAIIEIISDIMEK